MQSFEQLLSVFETMHGASPGIEHTDEEDDETHNTRVVKARRGPVRTGRGGAGRRVVGHEDLRQGRVAGCVWRHRQQRYE